LAAIPGETFAQTNPVTAASASAPAFHPSRILVMPRQTTGLDRLAEFHAAQRTEVLRSFPRVGNLQVLQLTEGDSVPAAVARYQQSGFVEFAEPDYLVSAAATTPDDPKFLDGTLWGLHNIGQNSGVADADVDAPEAWDILRFATNLIVAIVDSGVRYTHEDLAANLWRNPADGSIGLNAINGTTNVWDDYGHGTHLAGIIGGAGNNSNGVVGVAWQTRIMACKFLDSRGDGSNADAVSCIEYARSNGATVINLSWGGTAFSAAVSNAIYAAQSDGIIFTAAAGNNARDNDTNPFYPASLQVANLVSVGASTRLDNIWSSSSYGDNSVHLFAPGFAIFSTTASTDSSYGSMNGTSMATAYVSGALALLRQQSPSALFGDLVGRLLAAVDRPPAFAGKCLTGGRLNLLKALDRVTVAASGNPPLPIQLQMSGVPDHSYILQASTNLAAWSPLATNTAGPDGLWLYTDLQSTNLPQRFYRGIPGP
jgi:subtilisin family serine protease